MPAERLDRIDGECRISCPDRPDLGKAVGEIYGVGSGGKAAEAAAACAWNSAGVVPVHLLKAREKALYSEKPKT